MSSLTGAEASTTGAADFGCTGQGEGGSCWKRETRVTALARIFVMGGKGELEFMLKAKAHAGLFTCGKVI